MKFIPLEDAKTFLRSRRYTEKKGSGHVLALSPTVIDELDNLETIDLFAKIDEMIEEYENITDSDNDFDIGKSHYYGAICLQELKSRLSRHTI